MFLVTHSMYLMLKFLRFLRFRKDNVTIYTNISWEEQKNIFPSLFDVKWCRGSHTGKNKQECNVSGD